MLGDSLQSAFTSPIPKSAPAQTRYLGRQLEGTKTVAELLGISQRTVERYVKDQIERPLRRPRRPDRARGTPALAAAGPRPRQASRRHHRRHRHRHPQARFGFTAAPGSTDDARLRLITQALPPEYAARLFDAQDTGTDEQQLRATAAEGLQEIYFRGRRAAGLEVEFTDIDYIAFEL
jgi:hypothetical protein